jgi:hypothetical protein
MTSLLGQPSRSPQGRTAAAIRYNGPKNAGLLLERAEAPRSGEVPGIIRAESGRKIVADSGFETNEPEAQLRLGPEHKSHRLRCFRHSRREMRGESCKPVCTAQGSTFVDTNCADRKSITRPRQKIQET